MQIFIIRKNVEYPNCGYEKEQHFVIRDNRNYNPYRNMV